MWHSPCTTLYRISMLKALLLACLMGIPVAATPEPLVIDVPIIVFSQDEFQQVINQFKQLQEENEQLKSAYQQLAAKKACKVA